MFKITKNPINSNDREKVIQLLILFRNRVEKLATAKQRATAIMNNAPENIQLIDFEKIWLELTDTMKILFNDNDAVDSIPKVGNEKGQNLLLNLWIKFGELIAHQVNELNIWLKLMEYNKGNTSLSQCPTKQQLKIAKRCVNHSTDATMKIVVKITQLYGISKEDW